MNRDLEALLNAYDTVVNSPAREASTRDVFYRARLEEVAAQLSMPQAVLHRLIQRKYPRWLRAQQKPPSMPPKA